MNNSNKPNRTSRTRVIKALILATALSPLACSTLIAAVTPTMRVLPPNSMPYGKTYAQWSASWYRWVFSLPVTANPIFDSADCSAGQSGTVWFLGGNFTGLPETRTCTIRAGVALFFPVVNSEYDNTGCADSGVCPPTSFTPEQLLSFIKPTIDGASDISCTIDGVPVQGLSDATTTAYRVQAVFDYTLPADPNNFVDWAVVNFCGANPPGCYAGGGTVTGAAEDGIYVMVAPLAAGTHTIHFHAALFSGGFVEDITYNLTVE